MSVLTVLLPFVGLFSFSQALIIVAFARRDTCDRTFCDQRQLNGFNPESA